MNQGAHLWVGSGSTPAPWEVEPATLSQWLPGAGGVLGGHLKSPDVPRPPAGRPLRSGCKPMLNIVPGGKLSTLTPSRATWPAARSSTVQTTG